MSRRASSLARAIAMQEGSGWAPSQAARARRPHVRRGPPQISASPWSTCQPGASLSGSIGREALAITLHNIYCRAVKIENQAHAHTCGPFAILSSPGLTAPAQEQRLAATYNGAGVPLVASRGSQSQRTASTSGRSSCPPHHAWPHARSCHARWEAVMAEQCLRSTQAPALARRASRRGLTHPGGITLISGAMPACRAQDGPQRRPRGWQ